MVSVRIDHEMAGEQSGEPYAFYDLGDSYCTNPFWTTCPRRMACVGCNFNLPKESAKGHALESKASIGRYLEEVPLSADERGIVEGDYVRIDGSFESSPMWQPWMGASQTSKEELVSWVRPE